MPRLAGGAGVLHGLTQPGPRLRRKPTSPPSADKAPSGDEVVSILGPSGDEAVAEGNKSVALRSCGTRRDSQGTSLRHGIPDRCFFFFFPKEKQQEEVTGCTKADSRPCKGATLTCSVVNSSKAGLPEQRFPERDDV